MSPADADPMHAAERAALCAAGALPPDEERAVEDQLRRGDGELQGELDALKGVADALASAAPAATPPPAVRASLLDRVATDAAARATNSAASAASSGVYMQPSAEGTWQTIGIPGIRTRTLFVDRTRNIHSFLMQVDPGSEIPVHPHAGPEECYVISGELESYGRTLRAGDYLRAEAGTEHALSRSPRGCLLFVTAAIGDDVHSD